MAEAVSERRITAAIAFAADGVERSATGAPTAFRIWRAGVNVTDYGPHLFTRASAVKLMSAQSMRGNLFSIDVDHLSLSKEAPPEARKAAGFHRLAVRPSPDGPECWAVDVEWTDAVRAGLEKNPPEWRYFSPAYDVNKSGEIIAYLNTALTNNPATWGVTALASMRPREEPILTKEQIIATATAALRADQARASRMTPVLTPGERSLLARATPGYAHTESTTSVRATRRGCVLTMPETIPTREQARARVAELDAELAAIHAERM
jgi:phage I-like protein